MTTPIWRPSKKAVQEAQLTRFMNMLREVRGLRFIGYSELHKWSIYEPEKFWEDFARFARIRFSREPESILEYGTSMLRARWFRGARLNFAENLLRHCKSKDAYKTALVFRNETETRVVISYGELYSKTARLANFLHKAGVRPGDRLAGYLPNQIETVIACLAAVSVGAIWSCCSPDFGEASVRERFEQIEPRIFFSTFGYLYKGRWIDTRRRAESLFKAIPSIEKMVIVPYPGMGEVSDGNAHNGVWLWDDALAQGVENIQFCQMPFDHPLYILYSSGTTGSPKCIVHGAGGTLIQHLKELILHSDVTAVDTVFYYSTTGWMMWHWLISGLATGATLVLYDGSPFHPSAQSLWRIAEEERISVFGTSARYIAELQRAGIEPKRDMDLFCLKTILSTGSPLLPENFYYIRDVIKEDARICSISGGTDIISCFHLGNPTIPIYAGQLQCPGLGMDVAFVDDDCRPLVGRKGELVCLKSFPSMPVQFWKDADGSRYKEAYFSRWENVWSHGDYGMTTPEGGAVIFGRSDATLNPGGVRIGTAEIYRQVEKFPEIADALAIGQNWNNDVRVVLFIVMSDGSQLTEELVNSIKKTIRTELSPRHTPALVLGVMTVPRTLNGKLAELAVQDVVHGRNVKNLAALANPESLEQFRGIKELEI